MIHLIQNREFYNNLHYGNLLETIKRLDIDHQIVHFDKETHNLVFDPIETNNVFCWGSVRLAHIGKEHNWIPGSLYNENHDYRVYSQYYKENMLNYDSQIIKFGDEFIEPGYLFHGRPCEDTKSFTGQVFTKVSWNSYVDQMLKFDNNRLTKDTVVQISKLKQIQQEIRFFIVGGKIITASQYRMNERTIYQENTDSYMHDFVNDMIKLYQPAEAFVLDVAVTDNGLKIVEINCINCSGFYDINIQKLVGTVNEYFKCK